MASTWISAPRLRRRLTRAKSVYLWVILPFVVLGTLQRIVVDSEKLVVSEQKFDVPDLYMRWAEVRWIRAGFSPPQVKQIVRAARAADASPETLRKYHRLQSIELLEICEKDPDRLLNGYPPFSYVTLAALLWWPSLRTAHLLFWLIDTAALVAVSVWTRRLVGAQGLGAALPLIWSYLGMYGLAYVYEYGTLSLFVTLCLLICMWLLDDRDSILGGFLMGLALVKPTIALPFLLALLMKRRWKAASVAVVYNGLSAVAVCWWTATPILAWMRSVSASATTFVAEGVGLLRLLTFIPHADFGFAMKAIAPVCLVTAGITMYRYSRFPLRVHFAIAAVTSLMWSYFKSYDCAVSVFLLVPLGAAVVQRRTPVLMWAFALPVFFLWLPDSSYADFHRRAGRADMVYAFGLNLALVATALFALSALLSQTEEVGRANCADPALVSRS
jgi:hypothetical protein